MNCEDLPKTSGIYKLYNIITNKIYVGYSINIHYRVNNQHLYELRTKKHKNKQLQKDFDDFGKESFDFFVLQDVEEIENLVIVEMEWMKKLNVFNENIGYNIATNNSIRKGWKHTEEAKIKIGTASKKQKGKKKNLSEKSRKLISQSSSQEWDIRIGKEKADLMRKNFSELSKKRWSDDEDFRKKMSLNYDDKYGIEKSSLIREKMSQSKKGRTHTDETKELCRINKLKDLNPNYKYIPEDKLEIIKILYSDGKDIKTISENVGFSCYKIRTYLRENNLYKKGKNGK